MNYDLEKGTDIYNLSLTVKELDNRIGGVMVGVFTLSEVGRGFGPRLGRIKDCGIGVCCFSAGHAALGRGSGGWLAWNRDGVSEWGDISIHRLLFQCASTMKNPTKLVSLVQSRPHHHLIEN